MIPEAMTRERFEALAAEEPSPAPSSHIKVGSKLPGPVSLTGILRVVLRSRATSAAALPAASPLATAVHPKLVSELALVAAGMENPDHLRQLTTLARTLNARA